jgi:hypothetical protein
LAFAFLAAFFSFRTGVFEEEGSEELFSDLDDKVFV